MKIITVRFSPVTATMVGMSLDPVSSLTDGEWHLDGKVALSKYDDLFLKVEFTKGDRKYGQLIPWSTVSTVLFEDA